MEKITIDYLFYKARMFGFVYIHSHKDNTYSVNIKFNTVDQIELKATSGFGHYDLREALKSAISNAEKIQENALQTLPRIQQEISR